MRKLIILLLAFAITACGAAPTVGTPIQVATQELIQPTQTAMVVLQTVVVTVVPTNLPTEVPSATPLPQPTPTAVPAATQLPAATEAVAAPPQAQSATGGVTTLDNALGGGWFNNMTLTANTLSLRCQLSKAITFSVTPLDKNITQVQFYYRTEDKSSGAVFDWQNFGRMLPDAAGNFTLTFTGDNVSADFRKPSAWLDFQFVGLSKTGGVVGRSEKVVQQVNYTFDCP